jgi:Thioredoxin-like domain
VCVRVSVYVCVLIYLLSSISLPISFFLPFCSLPYFLCFFAHLFVHQFICSILHSFLNYQLIASFTKHLCNFIVTQQAKYVSGKYEKVKARYPSKSVKKDSLQKFYRSKSLPLVAEKNYLSTPRYAYVTVPLVTVYTDVDFKRNPKGYQYLANRISKIANEYVNKAIFVISDKSEFKHELIHYGLPDLSGMTYDIFYIM